MTMSKSMTVEIDENIFGEDLFNEEVLGAISDVFGDDAEAAKAAAEAAMAEQLAKAAMQAALKKGGARRQRKRNCPVVSCPSCMAELCVVQASGRNGTSASGDGWSGTSASGIPARKGSSGVQHPVAPFSSTPAEPGSMPSGWSGGDAPPPAPYTPPPAPARRSVSSSPKARVIGALTLLRPKTSSSGAPKALVKTGNVFSGACPSCGTNLDLTVAMNGVAQSPPIMPMTVKQIIGDEGYEEVLGEILGELLGADKPASKPVKPAGQPVKPADDQNWRKYLDLANQIIPTAVTAIADTARPVDKTKDNDYTATASTGNTPPTVEKSSFFTQDVGPLPLYGWGAILAIAGGGLWYWKKRPV